jgi:hypothetical protein
MNATTRAAASMLATLALFGCAATSQNLNSKPPATAAAAKDSSCLTQTGSKIVSDKPNCMAFGRSYSSQDIDRTGATSAGNALAIMDPSITVHR